jgi:8-oxo-dGTP pyrophosphatase MutT (NUDIX family)
MRPDLARQNARLQSAASAFDRARFTALHIGAIRIGWVRHDHAQRLRAWPEIFVPGAGGLKLAEDLKDAGTRTAALASVTRALAEQGVITGWRDEWYAVGEAFDQPPLTLLERAAARFFGVTTYAAHVNGYAGSGTDCRMWLARRGAGKPIDPGMLDNLVGGGIAAGVSVGETLIKEGREEAGIARERMTRAVARGTVRLLREVPEGAQSEIIFVHDLALPADFRPSNEDGEVAEFGLYSLDEVVRQIERVSEMTLDASLVAMRFLEGFSGARAQV